MEAVATKKTKRESVIHPYSSDRPITSVAEDRLGRNSFAEQLADDIRAWHGEDSLVIGLYGGWGSGKSSVKNLVVAALNRRGSKFPVLEFNPWQLSGTGQIAGAFFRELRSLAGAGSRKSSDPAQGVKLMAEYTASLTNDFAAFRSSTSSAEPRPLHELKATLVASMKKIKKPALVVLEDIDRLTGPEILEVFKLVKVCANLPNLVYLLLFERRAVEKTLDLVSGERGGEFLGKVIQVSYHLPQASGVAIERALFRKLDELLGSPGVKRRWNKNRWSELYRQGLSAFFTTFRHIHRFSASFDFHVRQFLSDQHFEVNPVDLMGLETLRVFEPEVFERLSQFKRQLTRSHTSSQGPKERLVESVSKILSATQVEHQPNVRKILGLLFPAVTEAFTGRTAEDFDAKQWMRDARVCHPDYFDRYFTLGVEEGDLSQTEFDRLLDFASNSDAFDDHLRKLERRGLLRPTFQRLDAHKEDVPLQRMPSLIYALSNLSDSFPEKEEGVFEVDVLAMAARLIYFGLLREKDEQRRFEILYSAFQRSDGVLLPVYVTALQEPHPGLETQRESMVSPAHWDLLKSLCLDKLRDSALHGRMREHPRASMLLWPWSDWSQDEVHEWVTEQLVSTDGAIWILNVLLSEVQSRENPGEVHHYIKLSQVLRFTDISLVESKLTGCDEQTLHGRDRIAVHEFRRAMKRREEGKSEVDGWRRTFGEE